MKHFSVLIATLIPIFISATATEALNNKPFTRETPLIRSAFLTTDDTSKLENFDYLDGVVISTNKGFTKIKESTVGLSILKPYLI